MRYYKMMTIMKTSAVLFTIYLLFEADLFSQHWSEPQIIFNKRRSSEFVTALDSKGRIHLAIPEDYTGDIWPDSLHYYIRENDCWQHLETFGKDTLKMPLADGLAVAVDENDKVHLLWGMLRGTEALTLFHVIYYTCFSDNKRSEITQLHEFPQKYGTDLGIHVLSAQNVLAYWSRLDLATISFKFLIGSQWQPTFEPLPQYCFRGNGMAGDPSIISGPGDSLHIAFIGFFNESAAKPSDFGNFVNYACKGLNDSYWKTIKLVYRNPRVPCHSPQIRVTKDGCRHIFWLVDENADIFPDNIYYAYSFDGRAWSEAINMTHYTPKFPYKFVYFLNVKQDSYGQLHVVWLYTMHPFYYNYRQGREDKWSDPIPIFQSDMSKKKCILDIDSEDKLHFFWLEEAQPGKYDSLRLKYATAQLVPVSVGRHPKPIEQSAPVEDFLLTCYPNPVNRTTNIIYEIPTDGNVSLSIYDITGRKIKDLISGFHHSGRYQILFSSDNFSTGMYFVQLKFSQQVLTKKILVVK